MGYIPPENLLFLSDIPVMRLPARLESTLVNLVVAELMCEDILNAEFILDDILDAEFIE